MNNCYLAHYGVKGMKWGVRRDRRASSLNRMRNYTGSRTSNALKAARRKDINKMSNQELQETINRLTLERNYRQLTQLDLGFGKRKVDDILSIEGAYRSTKNSATYKLGKKLLTRR